ncbi:MAG: translation initiation factor IF-2 [Acidimicrobiia bacterium]
MGKQVGELAKDLEIPMEELLQVLVKLGIEGKSESDVLEESEVDRVRIQLAGRRKAGTRRKTLARRGVQRPKPAAAKPTEVEPKEPEKQAKQTSSAKKQRPSKKKLLEAAATGFEQPDSQATLRRLGRAVRVQKEESVPKAPTSQSAKEKLGRRKAAAPPAVAAASGSEPGGVEQRDSKEKPRSESLSQKSEGKKLVEASSRSVREALPLADAKVRVEEEVEPSTEAPVTAEVGKSDTEESADESPGAITSVEESWEAVEVLPEVPVSAPARRKKLKKRGVEEEEVRQIRRRTEPSVPVVSSVQVRRGITVAEFATLIGVSPSEVVKKLIELGDMKSVTMSLTDEEVELLGEAFGIEVSIATPDVLRSQEEAQRAEKEAAEDEGRLKPRPPVVTVMGHVDHGKTLLLDKIRQTNVVEREAGGITQHIGAYRVVHDGRSITFIDTPGHEAFTAMRARGASVTDVAVLVVAADDGVMPQTIEAISHIRAAGVPFVVALNKIDKPEADPLRVKTQLTEHEVVVEELGGTVPCVEVSAKTGEGIPDLLDVILIVAELEDLKANPDAPGSGVCIEAHVDPGKGPVATVLVRRGTVRKGDPFIAGLTFGRVRAMHDENGHTMEEAGPSTPVQITGFEQVPEAGDDFRVVAEEKEARRIAEDRVLAKRQAEAVAPRVIRLEDIHERMAAQERSRLGLILKTDTQGSLEALTEALRKLERPEVQLEIVHRAVGGITENDVRLAQASEALIIGFNVRPDVNARKQAAIAGVEIRTYDVIYKVTEDIEAALSGLLEPETEEVVTGAAEVRAIFKVPRVGVVAGCYVQDGTITRGSDVRVLRDGVVVYTGRIASLKRFKEDVKEVQAGFECGVGLDSFQDVKEGDVLETFEVREVARGR